MKKPLMSFILLFFLISGIASAEERIINGGFETGDLTGWGSYSYDFGEVGVNSYDPYSGSYSAYIYRDYDQDARLYQTINLTDVEKITYFYRWGGGSVKIDTTTVASHSYVSGWTYSEIDVSSYSGDHLLDFHEDEDCSSLVIDNVSALSISSELSPVADFSGEPTSGTTPLTVVFTDNSTNTPTSWSWDFGDGNSSTSQNPSHEYAYAGTFTVSLTATNSGGNDTETKTSYIIVSDPVYVPVAAFSGTPTSGATPLTVTFTDSSTNSPIEWSWDFGDGNNSTEQNPVHEYNSAGVYSVTLLASNSAGSDYEMKLDYIFVSASTPTPTTTTPTSTATTTVTATPTPTTDTTYSGIHIVPTTDITAIHATLNGYVDNPALDPIVWFEIGTSSDYAYKTTNISSGSGAFSVLIESYPLIASETYYARAVCANGASEEEEAWTMETASSWPTSTFGTRANEFLYSNMSVFVLWDYALDTGGDMFGGGDIGVTIFVSFMVSIAFIILFGRAGDVIIPLEVGVMVISFIVSMLLPEFASLGYGLMVAAFIGVAYSLYRKSR